MVARGGRIPEDQPILGTEPVDTAVIPINNPVRGLVIGSVDLEGEVLIGLGC